MNTKLHAVTDAHGRPISLFMTASQVSDYTGAAACWKVFPVRNGCWAIVAVTLTGSGMLCRPRALRPASRPEVPDEAHPLR